MKGTFQSFLGLVGVMAGCALSGGVWAATLQDAPIRVTFSTDSSSTEGDAYGLASSAAKKTPIYFYQRLKNPIPINAMDADGKPVPGSPSSDGCLKSSADAHRLTDAANNCYVWKQVGYLSTDTGSYVYIAPENATDSFGKPVTYKLVQAATDGGLTSHVLGVCEFSVTDIYSGTDVKCGLNPSLLKAGSPYPKGATGTDVVYRHASLNLKGAPWPSAAASSGDKYATIGFQPDVKIPYLYSSTDQMAQQSITYLTGGVVNYFTPNPGPNFVFSKKSIADIGSNTDAWYDQPESYTIHHSSYFTTDISVTDTSGYNWYRYAPSIAGPVFITGGSSFNPWKDKYEVGPVIFNPPTISSSVQILSTDSRLRVVNNNTGSSFGGYNYSQNVYPNSEIYCEQQPISGANGLSTMKVERYGIDNPFKNQYSYSCPFTTGVILQQKPLALSAGSQPMIHDLYVFSAGYGPASAPFAAWDANSSESQVITYSPGSASPTSLTVTGNYSQIPSSGSVSVVPSGYAQFSVSTYPGDPNSYVKKQNYILKKKYSESVAYVVRPQLFVTDNTDSGCVLSSTDTDKVDCTFVVTGAVRDDQSINYGQAQFAGQTVDSSTHTDSFGRHVLVFKGVSISQSDPNADSDYLYIPSGAATGESCHENRNCAFSGVFAPYYLEKPIISNVSLSSVSHQSAGGNYTASLVVNWDKATVTAATDDAYADAITYDVQLNGTPIGRNVTDGATFPNVSLGTDPTSWGDVTVVAHLNSATAASAPYSISANYGLTKPSIPKSAISVNSSGYLAVSSWSGGSATTDGSTTDANLTVSNQKYTLYACTSTETVPNCALTVTTDSIAPVQFTGKPVSTPDTYQLYVKETATVTSANGGYAPTVNNTSAGTKYIVSQYGLTAPGFTGTVSVNENNQLQVSDATGNSWVTTGNITGGDLPSGGKAPTDMPSYIVYACTSAKGPSDTDVCPLKSSSVSGSGITTIGAAGSVSAGEKYYIFVQENTTYKSQNLTSVSGSGPSYTVPTYQLTKPAFTGVISVNSNNQLQVSNATGNSNWVTTGQVTDGQSVSVPPTDPSYTIYACTSSTTNPATDSNCDLKTGAANTSVTTPIGATDTVSPGRKYYIYVQESTTYKSQELSSTGEYSGNPYEVETYSITKPSLATATIGVNSSAQLTVSGWNGGSASTDGGDNPTTSPNISVTGISTYTLYACSGSQTPAGTGDNACATTERTDPSETATFTDVSVAAGQKYQLYVKEAAKVTNSDTNYSQLVHNISQPLPYTVVTYSLTKPSLLGAVTSVNSDAQLTISGWTGGSASTDGGTDPVPGTDIQVSGTPIYTLYACTTGQVLPNCALTASIKATDPSSASVTFTDGVVSVTDSYKLYVKETAKITDTNGYGQSASNTSLPKDYQLNSYSLTAPAITGTVGLSTDNQLIITTAGDGKWINGGQPNTTDTNAKITNTPSYSVYACVGKSSTPTDCGVKATGLSDNSDVKLTGSVTPGAQYYVYAVETASINKQPAVTSPASEPVTYTPTKYALTAPVLASSDVSLSGNTLTVSNWTPGQASTDGGAQATTDTDVTVTGTPSYTLHACTIGSSASCSTVSGSSALLQVPVTAGAVYQVYVTETASVNGQAAVTSAKSDGVTVVMNSSVPSLTAVRSGTKANVSWNGPSPSPGVYVDKYILKVARVPSQGEKAKSYPVSPNATGGGSIGDIDVSGLTSGYKYDLTVTAIMKADDSNGRSIVYAAPEPVSPTYELTFK